MIWNFTNKIQIGDLFVVNHGFDNIFGIGIITSDYIPPKETDLKNDYLLDHKRKVKWLTTEEFFIKKSFFTRRTLYKLSLDKWNQIIDTYSNAHDEINKNILAYLYDSFESECLNSDKGQENLKEIQIKSEEVSNNYKKILQDKNDGKDVTNDVLNHLININNNIFITDKDSQQISKENYPESRLKSISTEYVNVLEKLNNKFNDQKEEIFEDFSNNRLFLGFKTDILTRTLYFLNPEYYIINKHIIDTIIFFESFMNNNELSSEISEEIDEYYSNNLKLHEFLDELSNLIPELSDFRYFCMFYNYLYDSKLDIYANEKLLPLFRF